MEKGRVGLGSTPKPERITVGIPQELATRSPVRRLTAALPNAIVEAVEFRSELTVRVAPTHSRAALEFLKNDPELRFNVLSDLTAVDRYPLEPRFEIVYQLLALERGERLRLKARLPGDDPRIDSITFLWPAADMLEREVFDLFGVHFVGHPNLRRLMMPEDWEGHPLRKDYPVEGCR